MADDYWSNLIHGTVVYYAGAAQRPGKIPKFDFFYIHQTNSAIFFPRFIKQDWIPPAAKVRLLEWKARSDLIGYVSRGSPELHLDLITGYQASQPSGSWNEIFDRACKYQDDGHLSKLVRSIANGHEYCKPYEHTESLRIKGDAWLQLAHMAIDSVELDGRSNWVRNTGWDSAWSEVPEQRARL